MKFTLDPITSTEVPVRLYLNQASDGSVYLMAEKPGIGYNYLLTFHPDGRVKKSSCIGKAFGFRLTEREELDIE